MCARVACRHFCSWGKVARAGGGVQFSFSQFFFNLWAGAARKGPRPTPVFGGWMPPPPGGEDPSPEGGGINWSASSWKGGKFSVRFRGSDSERAVK